jgi:hypothetical protein
LLDPLEHDDPSSQMHETTLPNPGQTMTIRSVARQPSSQYSARPHIVVRAEFAQIPGSSAANYALLG